MIQYCTQLNMLSMALVQTRKLKDNRTGVLVKSNICMILCVMEGHEVV